MVVLGVPGKVELVVGLLVGGVQIHSYHSLAHSLHIILHIRQVNLALWCEGLRIQMYSSYSDKVRQREGEREREKKKEKLKKMS